MDHFVDIQMIHVTYDRDLHQRITQKKKKSTWPAMQYPCLQKKTEGCLGSPTPALI